MPMDEDTQKFMNEFKQTIQQQVGQIAGQQQQIASHLAAREQARQQAAQQQAQRAAPKMPEDSNERLLNEFVNNPTRFVSEMSSAIRQQATQESEQKLRDYQHDIETKQTINQFWGDFYAHNDDLTAYGPMVQAAFVNQPPGDPSQRANAAAEQVRQLMSNERQRAQSEEKRKSQTRNMASGLPPFANRGNENSEEQELDPKAETKEIVAEMNEWRNKRRKAV